MVLTSTYIANKYIRSVNRLLCCFDVLLRQNRLFVAWARRASRLTYVFQHCHLHYMNTCSLFESIRNWRHGCQVFLRLKRLLNLNHCHCWRVTSKVLSQMSTENIGEIKIGDFILIRQFTKFSSSPIFFLIRYTYMIWHAYDVMDII